MKEIAPCQFCMKSSKNTRFPHPLLRTSAAATQSPTALHSAAPEYQAAVLQAARDDLAQFGYTIISRHDSVTGEVLAYYEPNEQEVSQ